MICAVKNLRLTGVFWHEGRLVVSRCAEFGVASCGETAEEAIANLREAVELYLENAKMLGVLDQMPARTAGDRFTTQFEVGLR